MVKRLAIMWIVGAFVLMTFPSSMLAQGQEPIFQGLSWGDSIEEVRKVYAVSPKLDTIYQEEWIHDETAGPEFQASLGNIKVTSISFVFFDGRLMQIQVRVPDIISGVRAQSALNERYGKAKFELLAQGAVAFWAWSHGDDTTIRMPENMRSFTFSSNSITSEYQKWRESQTAQDAQSW